MKFNNQKKLSIDIEISPRIVLFHIGGGDEDIGPSEVIIKLKNIIIDLYIFEIIDEDKYTEIERFREYPNVNAQIIPFGIGEYDGEQIELQVNKHQLSSSILPPSKITIDNNPGYSGIKDWKENTELNYNVSAKLSSIDSLIKKGIVPKPDFLSLDIQGYELRALKGAENAMVTDVLGLVLESEFTEIYQGQDLFDDQSGYLKNKGFRLVEIYNPQKWFVGPPIGHGFLTVVESLYLRYLVENSNQKSNEYLGSVSPNLFTEEQVLKLAIISFAFERYSYFFTLIAFLEHNKPVFFKQLKNTSNLKAFIGLYEVLKNDWDQKDLTHSKLSKKFYKKYNSYIKEITTIRYRNTNELTLFLSSFRNLIYKIFPITLKIRLIIK